MNWISLGEIHFKLFEFYKIKNKIFSSLELKHMLYAQAKFGGPIAITSAPDEYIMGSEANNVAIKNVCIFKNDGNLLHTISKDGMSRIVGMDFLEEEYLIVIMQDGSYVLIDPHKGIKRIYNLGSRFMAEPIIEAKVIDNSVIFFTKVSENYKFYFVKNIFAPSVEAFNQGEFKAKPSFFIPISSKSSMSEKLECLVTHQSAGIHRLIEEDDEMILFNSALASTQFLSSLPNIKEIKVIAVSPSQDVENQMLAFYTNENSLYLVSGDFSRVLMKRENVAVETTDSKSAGSGSSSRKRTMRLLWCGEDAVALISSRKLHIVTKDNIYTKTYGPNTKALLPMQEMDGIKITSNNKCEILRALPSYYVNVFKINSAAKSKDLFEAFEDYESRQASYENNILTDKRGLQEAVEECIKAAAFELDVTFQLKLLRAAHFGKTFLNPMNSSFDHNSFSMTCKQLRVISAFRNERLSRAITCEQFSCLSEAQIVRILIRYQLYYIADEICKFLDFPPKLASQIYVSWACAKIESTHDTGESPEEQQEALAVAIYEKLKNESTISFAQIAKKAVEIGKDHLARKLLEKEKSFSKKLQVLLEMKDYLNSLREAIYSRDPNLIEMVIFKMHREPDLAEQNIWNLLSKTPLSKKLLLDYIKNFNPNSMNDFMITYSTGDERAFYAIKNGYTEKDLPRRMMLLKDFAMKFFKDKFCEEVTREQYEFLSQLIKNNGLQAEEISINSHLLNLFDKDRYDDAEGIRKKFKISDKNFYSLKVKALIKGQKWTELDALLADKNKKSPVVPWFCVVDMLVDAGEYDRVERYVIRLSDVDEQIAILKMINRYKTAAEVAFANKKWEALEEIRSIPFVDDFVKDSINQMLGTIKRK